MSKRLLFLLALFLTVVTPQLAAADKTDTRVLIDISGSMKQNDPADLRAAALRLMVGLMPGGSRAGVWTFAQYTNMLIPLGEVNNSWKQRARIFSRKISSPGQFTNIEDVLVKASSDWQAGDSALSKNLILLTDGMVDVSKSSSANKASRKRILDKVAPAIRDAGGVIHTIALSDNADHELMRQLAEMTGGWYEQVDSADQLQRVFLRLFEKVGKPDAVPLKGNKFSIDGSITEATLLIFTQDGAEPAKLQSPDGKIMDPDNLPQGVIWHRDQGYDLVTLDKPAAGEWVINAQMDPDNRVMVVTDLKMKTSEVPNRIALGESLPVEVFFTENNKAIERQSFIDVINVTVAKGRNGEFGEARPLVDNGNVPDVKAADGRFTVKLGDSFEVGNMELQINADGKSFVRERRLLTEVVAPAVLEMEDSDASTSAKLMIVLDKDVADPSSVNIDAAMESMSGKRSAIDFTADQNGQFSAVIDKQVFSGRQFIMLSVSGKTLSGNAFDYQPEQVSINGLKVDEPEPQPESQEPAQQPEEQPAQQSKQPEPDKPTAAAEAPVEEEAVEEETDWLIVGLAVVGGNLLLAGIGVGIWWFMRRRADDDELDMLVSEEAAAKQTKTEKASEPLDVAEPQAEPEPEIEIQQEPEAEPEAAVDASAEAEQIDKDDKEGK